MAALNSSVSSLPSLSIRLSIVPPTYEFYAPDLPELIVTVVSQAVQPLTIFTWHSILNPSQALKQNGFKITDTSTGSAVPLTISKDGKRLAFKRQLGTADEKYFLTLFPQIPVSIRARLPRYVRIPASSDIIEEPWQAENRKNGVNGLTTGHRHSLSVNMDYGSQAGDGCKIKWWRYGVKEDVLAASDDQAGASLGDSENKPLVIEGGTTEAVDFDVQ